MKSINHDYLVREERPTIKRDLKTNIMEHLHDDNIERRKDT